MCFWWVAICLNLASALWLGSRLTAFKLLNKRRDEYSLVFDSLEIMSSIPAVVTLVEIKSLPGKFMFSQHYCGQAELAELLFLWTYLSYNNREAELKSIFGFDCISYIIEKYGTKYTYRLLRHATINKFNSIDCFIDHRSVYYRLIQNTLADHTISSGGPFCSLSLPPIKRSHEIDFWRLIDYDCIVTSQEYPEVLTKPIRLILEPRTLFYEFFHDPSELNMLKVGRRIIKLINIIYQATTTEADRIKSAARLFLYPFISEDYPSWGPIDIRRPFQHFLRYFLGDADENENDCTAAFQFFILFENLELSRGKRIIRDRRAFNASRFALIAFRMHCGVEVDIGVLKDMLMYIPLEQLPLIEVMEMARIALFCSVGSELYRPLLENFFACRYVNVLDHYDYFVEEHNIPVYRLLPSMQKFHFLRRISFFSRASWLSKHHMLPDDQLDLFLRDTIDRCIVPVTSTTDDYGEEPKYRLRLLLHPYLYMQFGYAVQRQVLHKKPLPFKLDVDSIKIIFHARPTDVDRMFDRFWKEDYLAGKDDFHSKPKACEMLCHQHQQNRAAHRIHSPGQFNVYMREIIEAEEKGEDAKCPALSEKAFKRLAMVNLSYLARCIPNANFRILHEHEFEQYVNYT